MRGYRSEAFIITHGDLAFALLNAAEGIIGKQDHVHVYSNKKDSLSVLFEKITKVLQEIKSTHIIFFVDLMGGSCCNLAKMLQKRNRHIVIITGVNLPMLISYFINYKEMPFANLVKKVRNDGNRGIHSIIN
jgi:mannose/fructose-specific phosphotransferase system component IIA